MLHCSWIGTLKYIFCILFIYFCIYLHICLCIHPVWWQNNSEVVHGYRKVIQNIWAFLAFLCSSCCRPDWKPHWSYQIGYEIDCYWLLTFQNCRPACLPLRTPCNQSQMAAANEISSWFCFTTLFVPQSIGKGTDMLWLVFPWDWRDGTRKRK